MSEKELILQIINVLDTEYHNYNKAHEISLLLNYEDGYIYILQDIEYMYKKMYDNTKIAEKIINKFYMLPSSKV